jgi:MFS family permease
LARLSREPDLDDPTVVCEQEQTSVRRAAAATGGAAGRMYGAASVRLTSALGGALRARVVLLLAAVLGLSSADASTVGASATQLRHALHISNTQVGLLVAVTSLVGAAASLPFGAFADRVKRTRTLGVVIGLWGRP